MKLAKVIGRTVLSKKDTSMPTGFLVLLSPLHRDAIYGQKPAELATSGFTLVAFDSLGAGIGDTVSYVEGAEATAPFDAPVPIDAFCVGIVEKINSIYNRK